MAQDAQGKPFLGVYFMTCNAYGRLYKNAEGSAYEGRCPRCGSFCKVAVGTQGTNERFFRAFCKS